MEERRKGGRKCRVRDPKTRRHHHEEEDYKPLSSKKKKKAGTEAATLRTKSSGQNTVSLGKV